MLYPMYLVLHINFPELLIRSLSSPIGGQVKTQNKTKKTTK
jgi:hypothetical protein